MIFNLLWITLSLKLIIQMDVLYTIKFAFNRSQIFGGTLIILRQSTFLGIIAAAGFQNFYYTLFEVFAYQGTHSFYFLIFMLIYHLLIALLPLIAAYYQFSGSKVILKGVSIYLKLFPYLFFITFYNYCISTAMNDSDLITRVAAFANLPFHLAFILFHQLINESLKFREMDFCNRRIVSYTGSLLMPLAILALRVAGPFYSILFCLIRSAYEVFSLFNHCQYELPQKIRVFFALFTFYFSFLIILQNFSLININLLGNPLNTILILFAGVFTSWMLSGAVVTSIWRKMLANAKGAEQKGEGNLQYSEELPLVRIQNQIKILVQSFIERQRHLQGKKNNYEHFWQQFREVVFLHKLKCQETRCICKSRRDDEDKESLIYLKEMLKILADGTEIFGKETRLKVLNIYLLIEIARKPFKGYYELMILKKEKLPTTIKLQVQNLIQISRECFDQIFFKNKVQNQQLDLLKVISAEESIGNLAGLIKQAITAHINFLDIFTYSNVKMSQVQAEAQKLKQLKAKIDKMLQVLAVQYSQNPSVSLSMYIFYKHLQVYRSREVELKKLSGQHALKKRLLVRAEGDNVSEQKGIIYCDLIEQRGKIIKMTKNIPDYFGYARQEMLGFNINLFMPTLFGKYHAKFLSNFVDKGRIKLLKSKNRMVFGKNKKKFIFPFNVQLKTQHLLANQFGASALIAPADTSSEFIIIGKNGRIQEITEALYRRIFSKTLREQVWKTSRICGYKILPALNQILENWEENQLSKIFEGVLIYTEQEDYLQEKFRHARDATYTSMSYKTKTSSMSLISTASLSSGKETSRSQHYQYFTELFKAFLVDIDPKKLKAFKVSFKYSKMKTSQFEVQLVEVLSTRQELMGKEFLRQVLNQFTNVAQIFELNEDHSLISNHLGQLQEKIESQPSFHNKAGNLQLKLNIRQSQMHSNQIQLNQKDTSFHSATGSQDELVQSNQKRGNPQASDQNSMLGTTDSESKRLILINAFNTTQRALPASAITCAFIASLTLFALLIGMTLLYFISINNSQSLWSESSYLLSLTSAFEFRVGLAEIVRFGSNANLSLSNRTQSKIAELNDLMVLFATNINQNTSNTDVSNGTFAFSMPIVDPFKNLTYLATFPQAVSQLSHYFLGQSPADKDILRYNYQNLHQNLSNFYQQRYDFYNKQKNQYNKIMIGFLSVYSAIIFLIALSSIPIFLYFKNEEEAVRNKLAFMNIREIRKAIGRLKLLYQAFKGLVSKGAANRLQNELNDLKNQKDQELGGTKMIKLTSQSEGFKQLLCRPRIYCLLLVFVVFFSNLSLTLQILFNGNNAYFLAALDANKMQNQLSNKAPLLLNVYLSNLNRILQTNQTFSYFSSTINEAESGYFDLISTLSLPNYTMNSICNTVNKSISSPICDSVACTQIINNNLQDITQIFKNRFNYWSPNNKITISPSTITQWSTKNNISAILQQATLILSLNQNIQSMIDSQFYSELSKWKTIGMWLAVILLPLNAVILLIILRKYLNQVNEMVHSAQQLFMHFPAQVLVENTYLTSYFNAKSKSGK